MLWLTKCRLNWWFCTLNICMQTKKRIGGIKTTNWRWDEFVVLGIVFAWLCFLTFEKQRKLATFPKKEIFVYQCSGKSDYIGLCLYLTIAITKLECVKHGHECISLTPLTPVIEADVSMIFLLFSKRSHRSFHAAWGVREDFRRCPEEAQGGDEGSTGKAVNRETSLARELHEEAGQ